MISTMSGRDVFSDLYLVKGFESESRNGNERSWCMKNS